MALLSTGAGNLIFHCCTKFKVPVFPGSSFAFLAAATAVIRPEGTVIPGNVPLAQGGIIFALGGTLRLTVLLHGKTFKG
nr:solute carrier family 23 protein [Clostridium sp. WB02_MRS01]